MSADSTVAIDQRGIFPGNGPMACRMRDIDWSRTVLGPPENWAVHLRTLVALCLTSELPMVLWWGPERAMFWNDRFAVAFGEDGTASEPGTPPSHGNLEWWSTIRPLVQCVEETGSAQLSEEFPPGMETAPGDAGTLVRFSLTPLFSPGGAQLDGVLGIVTETARIAAFVEPAEARLEEKLRRAMEIETTGIIFFNTTGALTDANDAFLRMSGFSRADLQDGLIRREQITPADWMPHARRAMEEMMVMGRTTLYEKQYLRKDGSRWWALYSAAQLDENEAVEFIIDITDRKAADDELRRHRDDLEMLVQERTAALDAVNGALREEIYERQRAEALRHEMQRQLASAQEEERRRISRELHDEVGQHLTALILGLKSLESEHPGARPDRLAALQAIAARIGKQIHDLALELRPTALDDLGLLRALSHYIEEWSAAAKIEVDFHCSGWCEERLPPVVETASYRIVQEALTNVLKHARATRVSLLFERRPRQVAIIIEDDGQGFDPDGRAYPQSRCLGLLGMEERAALVDGEVKIESTPGSGTTVFVRLPVPVSSSNPNGQTPHPAGG